MIPYKQLTLAEVFEDCQNKFDNDKYQFLSLLDQTINLDEIVPVSFVTHFHASTGRPRKHQLYPILKAFLIQRRFSIPTDIMFDHMVDMTEPICQKLDPHLAAMTIFDTSGIEALLPVLVDFFQKHPLIAPKTFLGDAAFDTIEICKSLFGEIGFEKAFISLRVKLSMDDNGYTINENGVPCCPHIPSLPMKREASKSNLKNKIPTMKFVMP